MTAAAVCRTCGTELREGARFCDGCGMSVVEHTAQAEYKQVTVLFADVVHSMDIAAAVDAERLREIMADLADCCAAVVGRYGGTLDKFTGDGIMAVFGAPVALEDHAVRACLAALAIQDASVFLASEVRHRDGIELKLRVGLNSGRVVAGEIGSSAHAYTAVGQSVGMAQRMESVAPPGGVMVSESTALLVQDHAVMSDPQLVHIKGFRDPVLARLLLDVGRGAAGMHREQSTLVGRSRELTTLTSELEQAISGRGRVVEIVGSPGIGKSRIVAETARLAGERGVEVISANCESHATDAPLGVAVRLLQEIFGVAETEPGIARMKLRALFAGSDSDDVLLLENLLGIRDAAEPMPDIAPQASRRRVERLINNALLERKSPAMYVVEDVHWIDAASETALAGLISVLAQGRSMVVVTHRPEFRGALLQAVSAMTIVLAPLTDIDTSALVGEWLGPQASATALASQICEQADGNPFFAEEIVRDLAARGVVTGTRGAYACPAHPAEVTVPATLEAAVAARIDRLDTAAKRTLNTAAVIGTSFDAALIADLVEGDTDASLAALVEAELIDQTRRVPRVQYAFRHPLIRTVAYESQLKSVREEQHRQLAAAIQERDVQVLDQSAAVIAGHLEAAGDLHGAYLWHMRAGAWLSQRDIRAARASWRHAAEVADMLPATDGDRSAMQTTTRTMLCATAWRVGIATADSGFDGLAQLCNATGDTLSQTVVTALRASAHLRDGDVAEAARLAREVIAAAESFDDETAIRLTANMIVLILNVAEAGEALRVAQRIIDLADGDPAKGYLPHSSVGSPLVSATMTRGAARAALGIDGWKDDLQNAVTMARGFDLASRAMVTSFVHLVTTSQGWLKPDASAVDESEEILRLAEQFGDDLALTAACVLRGAVLRHRSDSEARVGLQMLTRARELARNVGVQAWNPFIDIEAAKAKADDGDLDDAIAKLHKLADEFFNSGEMAWYSVATSALVQALLTRGGDDDAQAAETAIDRLARAPAYSGLAAHEVVVSGLCALLARARGDGAHYREYRNRYRDRAKALGFEGHIAWAEAMP